MHQEKPALVVMAAGLGSRFGGLKQVAGIGPSDETILDYCLFDAQRAGFGRAVFIIRENIEGQFRERIGDRWSARMPVEYAFQELHMLPHPHSCPEGREKPWGTGHALLQVEGMIDGPFAVINADDFYGQEAFQVLGNHLSAVDENASDPALVGFELSKTLSPHGAVSRGICATSPEGWLETITETHGVERSPEGGAQRRLPDGGTESIDGHLLASMNMWGFQASLFDHLNSGFAEFLAQNAEDLRAEFLIPEVVKGMLDEGSARVRVLHTSSPCIGVTHAEDLALVQAHVRALVDDGTYPRSLFPKVRRGPFQVRPWASRESYKPTRYPPGGKTMFSRSAYLPLFTILTACGGAAAGAQQPVGPDALARAHLYEVAPEQVAQERQEEGIVEVSGIGTVSVSPDRAVVGFAVETRDESAAAAADNNARAMDAVLTALRAAGLTGLTLETHGYSLQPEYGTVQEGNRRVRVIEGYAALNNVRAGLEDIDQVGRVIDVAIEAGANRVSGLSFVASNTDAARQQALTMAVEQAREQAVTMAAALGHELGTALEVRGGSALPRPRPEMLMRAEGVAAATPIEAADQTVTATVTIKFALGPRRSGR